MKTKMGVVALIAVTVGVFSITHMKNAPPSDLRDAVADLTDIKVSDIKAGSSSDIPMPAPPTDPASVSEKEGAAAYAKIIVDEQIPAGTSDIVKAALNDAAGKIAALSPDISIMFTYNPHIPNNPQVSFLAPNARRVIFLHEAKQLRYEWAPAQKKPLLFFGQKAHPNTMDIREQVEAVLDCAAFLAKDMSGRRPKPPPMIGHDPVTLQDLRDTRREIFRMDFEKISPSQKSKAGDLLHMFGLEILQAEAVLLKTGKAELKPEYLNKKVNPRLVELRKTELKAAADFSATGDDVILAELHEIFAEIFKIHLDEQTFAAI